MFQEFKELQLFGKRTFVKAKLKPPFRLVADMPSEACFYYVLKGKASIYTPIDKVSSEQGEGVLMECGTYLNLYHENEDEVCEAIGIHLYPEVIKSIYDKDLPDFLDSLDDIKPIHIQKVPSSQL